MERVKMYQVSTLQALMLGYSRSVITVSELLEHGNIGLGTFEDVDGEMICLDGICYRATNIDSLKVALNNLIEEDFGLNSMHMVRIGGEFSLVDARSESPYRSMHVTLKTVLEQTQKAFCFEHIKGTLVCVYFPDYMDGINAAGWHLHFVSEDRKQGGHVFEISMKQGTGILDKISSIEIKLPEEPVFDTYSLKNASNNEIKQVEQGKS